MVSGLHIIPFNIHELPNHLTSQESSFSPAESGQALDASYMDHESLAYGADWCKSILSNLPLCETPDQSRDESHDSPAAARDGQSEACSISSPRLGDLNQNIVATCSFYDHALHVWTLPETTQWGMDAILIQIHPPPPTHTHARAPTLDYEKENVTEKIGQTDSNLKWLFYRRKNFVRS